MSGHVFRRPWRPRPAISSWPKRTLWRVRPSGNRPRIKEFVDGHLGAEGFWPEPLLQLSPAFERHVFGNDVICVGTSATMASDGTTEDRRRAVAKMACRRRRAGAPFPVCPP